MSPPPLPPPPHLPCHHNEMMSNPTKTKSGVHNNGSRLKTNRNKGHSLQNKKNKTMNTSLKQRIHTADG